MDRHMDLHGDLIGLEQLDEGNYAFVQAIQRDDVSEDFVDTAQTIMELNEYGKRHNLIGRTFAVKLSRAYIGLILMGEAIEWETDPDEMKGVPFYRIMGFVMDKRYRGRGIGGYVLEKTIEAVYREFGVRPIALGVHRENVRAERFYLRHGFRKTDVIEGNDYYYLRYPE